MGFLRKTVKKIGKAIKKVVKKVGKAFGKLGIVGQIGMMFLMPHLGAMWSNIGSWAAQGSNILQKAVGVIHKAGTAIGNTYKTVTEAIGNGFDRAKNFMKGEGFVLSPEKTSIFAKPTDALTDKATDVVTDKATGITIDKTGVDLMKPDSTNIQTFDKSNLVEEAKEKITQPSILDKVKDEAIDQGIKAFGDLTRKKIAGPPEEQIVKQYAYDTGSLPGLSGGMGVADTVDFTRQSVQMNNWQDISQVYAPFISRGM